MHVESVCTYALHSLPADEAIALEAHLTACAECRRELKSFQPVIDSLVGWPTDILRPTPQLWGRLAQRIADETGAKPFLPRTSSYREPAWEEVASGIFCKILASDAERSRVTMLVHLEPYIDYPPHSHAGVEELHLLEGELWIDERKLSAGDYNRAEPGTGDKRVWSETGCTWVLITSPADVLG